MALVLLIASVIAQIIAVAQALRLSWRQRRPGWIMLAIGMGVMLWRRLLRFYEEWVQGNDFQLMQEFVGLLISLALAIGLTWLINWPADYAAKTEPKEQPVLEPMVRMKQRALLLGLLSLLCMAVLVLVAYQENQKNFPLMLGFASVLVVVMPLSLGLLYQVSKLAQQTAVAAIKRQQESEQATQEGTQAYRTLVETSQELIYTLDPAGCFTFINAASRRVFGYTPEEMLGRPFTDFESPEQTARDLPVFQRILGGENVTAYETQLLRQDRTVVWLNVSAVPLRNEAGVITGVTGTAQDITERKQTERALRDSEERMRRLVDSNVQGIIFTNITGRITLANDAFLKMVGYTREEFAAGAVNWSTMTPPEFAARDRQAIAELAANGVCTPWEKEYIRKDGTRVPVFVGVATFAGSKEEGVAFVIDNTERKRAELALRESEEQFRRLIEHAPEAVVILDMQTRKFTHVNQAAERMFRLSASELCQFGPLELSPSHQPDGQPSAEKAGRLLAAAMADESPVFEWMHRDLSGREFPCEIRLLRLEIGGRYVVRGSLTDISERKRAEQAQNETIAKLEVILRAAPVGIGVSVNRSFIEVNDTLCQMLGYPRGEMLNRHLRFLYESDDEYDRIGREYQQLCVKTRGDVETRYRRKDGLMVDVLVTAVLIDAANPSAGVLFTVTDITERKKTEQASRLGIAALEAAANAISITNYEGVMQWVNPAFTKFSGYSAAEAIGRKPNLTKSGVHEPAFYRDLWETVLAGRVWRGQITNRHKDGHFFVTEQTISPVQNEHGEITHFVSVQQDITDRRKAEEALRLSREQFIDLFDNAPVGYHEVDAEGRITRINQTELNMLGYTAEELLGEFVWKIASDERDSHEAVVHKLSGSLTAAQTVERFFRRKDGSIFPVLIEDRLLRSDEGDVVGIRSVVQDITARKQAEGKARHLANFPELNPNPVLEFNAVGELVYHNPAALSMAQHVGFPNLQDLLPPQIRQLVSDCLVTGQPHLRFETHHSQSTLSWSFYPITAQQVVHCYVGDITKRLQLEEQFRQAQKMEAIGQLSGGVAHDFNNLLTVIMGNLGLLQASGQLTRELVEPLQAISHAANRAANLTRQLLAFSRQQVMQQQNLDLNTVVGNISKMLRRVIGEAVQIRLDYALQSLPIHADPGMLEQVILNLCINARDAMPAGGQLTLRTTAVELGAEHVNRMATGRTGAFAMLAVSDNGTGIAPENLKRVFEPFFTTKEVGKGTGLGLASVYGIAQQHKGWVTVESELGTGTTFSVYLPLQPASPVRPLPSSPSAAIPQGTETILLVEDDIAVQTVAKIALTRLGYKVLVANNGRQALKIWQEQKAEIKLVLTDMIMPEGLSGRDIARRFKDDVPGIRIIFMSGYNADIAGTDFSQEQGDAFIGKPFEMHALATLVRKSLDMGGNGQGGGGKTTGH